MSVCEDELLAIGQLLAQGADEAHWRTSIGRSYYAGFHAAQKWHMALPSPGSIGHAKGSHSVLINSLSNPTVSSSAAKTRSKSIGFMLSAARALRVKADYKLAETVDVGEAQTAAAFASKVCTAAANS